MIRINGQTPRQNPVDFGEFTLPYWGNPTTVFREIELSLLGILNLSLTLLSVVPQGRHRYYRLTSPAVAELLEKLAALAPPTSARSLRESHQRDALRQGRTCYDHLAGQLGVAWTQAWVTTGRVIQTAEGFMLTPGGAQWLADINLPVGADTFIPQHEVDWTERIPHMAGPNAIMLWYHYYFCGTGFYFPVPLSIFLTQSAVQCQ